MPATTADSTALYRHLKMHIDAGDAKRGHCENASKHQYAYHDVDVGSGEGECRDHEDTLNSHRR